MIFNVIIDTCAYEEKGFNWHCTELQCLIELVRNGLVELFLCSMIEAECKRHIKDKVLENASKINSGIKNLCNLTSGVFQTIDEESTIRQGIEAFEQYHEQARRITAVDICLEDIINDYATMVSPFEDNSKKANEFKDAISVYSIVHAFEHTENDAVTCVISSDKGFTKAIKSRIECLYFPSVKHFLDFYNRYTNTATQKIKDACQQDDIHDSICDAIDDSLRDIDIRLCYSDIDPDEISVIDLETEKLVYNVLNVENQHATISVNATIVISTDFTFIDEDQSFYDREEQNYLFQTIVTRNEKHKVDMEFCVVLDFSACCDCLLDGDTNPETLTYDWSKVTLESVDSEADFINLDETTCIESEDIEVNGPFHDEDYGRDYATNTCPDCGCPINLHNDGGNGFCINCAPNH